MCINDEATRIQIPKQLAKRGIVVNSSAVRRSRAKQGWTLQCIHYCQLIRVANKVKRLEYAQQILDSGDAFHNVIFSDECSVSLEQYRRTCYRKVDEPFKRKPKPKHSLKVHVWEGISRKGATKVCIFDGIMVQNCTAVFQRQPYYHSSIRRYQTTDLCRIMIPTYDKMIEGLLRGE